MTCTLTLFSSYQADKVVDCLYQVWVTKLSYHLQNISVPLCPSEFCMTGDGIWCFLSSGLLRFVGFTQRHNLNIWLYFEVAHSLLFLLDINIATFRDNWRKIMGFADILIIQREKYKDVCLCLYIAIRDSYDGQNSFWKRNGTRIQE